MDCLFCKIVEGTIPAKKAFEDDTAIAFYDISPQAPVHVLVIPKKPIARVGAATTADQALLGHLLLTAGNLAKKLGVSDSGYRLVINSGSDGGETVPHLHVHLLGQRPLAWPPG